jgi:maltooligosyltrehalose trehalohydrolase
VGNRAAGERLSALVNFEALKLAAGISLLSPFIPLLFMGEEYGETAPFQYFTSHADAKLVEAVRRGRREEFAAFEWKQEVPDPQDENTFLRSRLHHSLRTQEPHNTLLRFYRELIRFRTKKDLGKPSNWEVGELGDSALLLKRATDAGLIAMVFNFAGFPVVLERTELEGSWKTRIYSADSNWNGPDKAFAREVRFSKPFALGLHPHSFVVFESLPSGSEPA